MRRGSLVFAVALFLVCVLLLKATLAYSFRAKLFPLITLLTVMIFLAIQIIWEVTTFVSKEKEVPKGMEADSFGTKHITTWVWMLGSMIMLWILGLWGQSFFFLFFISDCRGRGGWCRYYSL